MALLEWRQSLHLRGTTMGSEEHTSLGIARCTISVNECNLGDGVGSDVIGLGRIRRHVDVCNVILLRRNRVMQLDVESK